MRHLSLLEKIIRIVVLKKERSTEIFLINRGDTYRLDPTVPRTNLFVFLYIYLHGIHAYRDFFSTRWRSSPLYQSWLDSTMSRNQGGIIRGSGRSTDGTDQRTDGRTWKRTDEVESCYRNTNSVSVVPAGPRLAIPAAEGRKNSEGEKPGGDSNKKTDQY